MGKWWLTLFLGAPKSLQMLTAAMKLKDAYSLEGKLCLLLGRKVMTNLDSIFKSRDITLPTKVHLDKAMVFPVVMYGCESWTRKKAEHQKTDAFELWCWRRSPGNAGNEGPHLPMTGASRRFSRAAAPVWCCSRCIMGSSGSLSCGAREVRFLCAWLGGARHCSRVMVGESHLKTR